MLEPFLAHYLKNAADPHLAKATVFETGSNRWRRLDSWPPVGLIARKLYLAANHGLNWAAPTEARGSDSYVADPAKPVPNEPRPVRRLVGDTDGLNAWRSWLLMDQRFVDGRPDVLTYMSEPLKDKLVLRGTPTAHLFAATSGTDADWVIKLIDVFPEDDAENPRQGGYEMMVSADILRGRYRESPSTPRAIKANQPLEYVVSLPQLNHAFRPGHRLMVQIQSSWFPLYDRNPQVFVPNIMDAKADDYQRATQTVYRDARHASYVEVLAEPEGGVGVK